MKKIKLIILIFSILILSFLFFVKNNLEKTEENHKFIGVIKAVYNNTIIVEPLEDFEERKITDKFTILKSNDVDYRLGEYVKIVYPGEIYNSYPAQIKDSKVFGMDLGDLNAYKESDIKITKKDVMLGIKKHTLTASGATIILKNLSKKNYEYGETYMIEVNKNGKWYSIDIFNFFNMPAYHLGAGETKEIKIKWENGYGKLPEGTYRIIKNLEYKKSDSEYETSYIAAEFTIK